MGKRNDSGLCEVLTVYNVSLQNPAFPERDALARHAWKNPLVPLDQAIKATVGSDDFVIGDPTNFSFDSKSGDGGYFDWGWDLDTDWVM